VTDAPCDRLDPAALQVLIARLTGIATEMGAVLARSAFSPNIKERHDHSAALFTPAGELLVQAEHIPVHLGSMPASVAAVIERFGPATDGWSRLLAAGDDGQVVLNDPFTGGTHLNDITVVAPCVVDDRLVGWVANRAHHADVGGAAPGSMPADAVEIFAEGLRIPPVLLTAEVRQLLCANSRTPDERLGDLDAQVGANRRGVERLAGLADAPLDEVLAHGERRMRSALAALPDGTWTFEDVVDSFGPRPEQQVATRVAVEVRVAGDELTFDLTGSEPQRVGNVNAVRPVAVSAAIYALRCALPADMPVNGGALRAVAVITTPGTIVDALAPAAVGAGNVEVSQRVADVCLGALAQVVPGQLGAASQGTMNNLLVGGTDADGRAWVYYETVAGGQGGRVHGPGMSGVHTGMTNTSQVTPDDPLEGLVGLPGQSGIHTGMTNTKNTPIEALERAFPLRVLRQRLRQGSGGAGAGPGGEGIERDLQVLTDATCTLITERRVSQPWGLAGGGPAAVGENWLLPGGDEGRAERLPDKCTIDLKAGDVLRMLTPGGGGWGKTLEV
jgi:N-methylhydantoinase B/oxoprolinase/acetone carboxylase alpha subunit